MEIVDVQRDALLPREDPAFRRRHLRERILAVVAAGSPLWHEYAVGWSTWVETRRSVGGWNHAPEFRAAVDDLLSSGDLLEMWLEPRGLEDPMHVLLIPGTTSPLPRLAIRARGWPELVQRVLGPGWPQTWR